MGEGSVEDKVEGKRIEELIAAASDASALIASAPDNAEEVRIAIALGSAIAKAKETSKAIEELIAAAGLVLGMAAVWNIDPDKSPNTMNVGFKALTAALESVDKAGFLQLKPRLATDDLTRGEGRAGDGLEGVGVFDTFNEAFTHARRVGSKLTGVRVCVRETKRGSTLWRLFPNGDALQAIPPSDRRSGDRRLTARREVNVMPKFRGEG